MGNDEMQQIDVVHWRSQEIPVMADLQDGQPVGIPIILLSDMPQDFREAFNTWLRDVRIIKIGTSTSLGIYLDDIEQFLAYDQDKPADED
jgi:hypothetical protein